MYDKIVVKIKYIPAYVSQPQSVPPFPPHNKIQKNVLIAVDEINETKNP